MTLRLGGDGAITGCTSLENPDLTVSGLTISGSFDAEKVLVSSGTAAAPSYTFSGDTDNGLYYAGTNSIGLSTAGTNALLIDSGGNLNFSQEASSNYPEQKLKWSNDSTTTNGFYISQDSNRNGRVWHEQGLDIVFGTTNTERMRIDYSGNLGLGVSPNNTTNFTTFTLAGTTGGNIEFQDGGTLIGSIYNLTDQFIIQGQGSTIPVAFRTNSTERMRIDSSGNVGVGTSSPQQLLHLKPGVGQPIIYFDRVGGPGGYSELKAGTGFTFSQDSNELVRITDTGSVGIGTSSPGDILHCEKSAGAIKVSSSSDSKYTALYAGDSSNDSAVLWQNGALRFYNTTERMRIDNSGNVGIGTTSPNHRLTLHNPSTGTFDALNISTGITNANGWQFGIDSAGEAFLWYSTNGPMKFATGNVERMRISHTGVGIGTSSPATPLHIASQNPSIRLQSNAGAYQGRNTIGQYNHIFYIECDNDNLVSSSAMAFTIDATERMRIDSSGNVGIGTSFPAAKLDVRGNIYTGNNIFVNTTSQVSSGNISVVFDGTTLNGMCLKTTRDALNSAFLVFIDSDGTTIGSVQQNTASTVLYATSSDYRLKENVAAIADGINRVKQLKPCRFNFTEEPIQTVDGFLAHEAQAVVPEAVSGTKDEVDENGDPVMQGIDQSKLVPLLTAALQEAIAKIETLEAKVAALEAG